MQVEGGRDNNVTLAVAPEDVGGEHNNNGTPHVVPEGVGGASNQATGHGGFATWGFCKPLFFCIAIFVGISFLVMFVGLLEITLKLSWCIGTALSVYQGEVQVPGFSGPIWFQVCAHGV